jgi:hypothetical protein
MGGLIAYFVVMSVAGRTVTAVLPVLLVMELRSIMGLLMLLRLVLAAGGLKAMRTPRPLAHVGAMSRSMPATMPGSLRLALSCSPRLSPLSSTPPSERRLWSSCPSASGSTGSRF